MSKVVITVVQLIERHSMALRRGRLERPHVRLYRHVPARTLLIEGHDA